MCQVFYVTKCTVLINKMWFADLCTLVAVVGVKWSECHKSVTFHDATFMQSCCCHQNVRVQVHANSQGLQEGRCLQPQPHFPESPDIFTSLLMRAVREQEPCKRAACESTEAPLCLQIWSRYRNEKREQSEPCECMWIAEQLIKKGKIFKTRAICKRDRMRDESRELRGSTFSLAFAPAFTVVSRWLWIVWTIPLVLSPL